MIVPIFMILLIMAATNTTIAQLSLVVQLIQIKCDKLGQAKNNYEFFLERHCISHYSGLLVQHEQV